MSKKNFLFFGRIKLGFSLTFLLILINKSRKSTLNYIQITEFTFLSLNLTLNIMKIFLFNYFKCSILDSFFLRSWKLTEWKKSSFFSRDIMCIIGINILLSNQSCSSQFNILLILLYEYMKWVHWMILIFLCVLPCLNLKNF